MQRTSASKATARSAYLEIKDAESSDVEVDDATPQRPLTIRIEPSTSANFTAPVVAVSSAGSAALAPLAPAGPLHFHIAGNETVIATLFAYMHPAEIELLSTDQNARDVLMSHPTFAALRLAGQTAQAATTALEAAQNAHAADPQGRHALNDPAVRQRYHAAQQSRLLSLRKQGAVLGFSAVTMTTAASSLTAAAAAEPELSFAVGGSVVAWLGAVSHLYLGRALHRAHVRDVNAAVQANIDQLHAAADAADAQVQGAAQSL